ncbi:hypothetical protein [Pseudarthrobacter sp. H2]|uniref:hypothetical protein n=1 Tax=Pseudarthrobacter sp. H2 TaxID=3418415 RepID=UPI003CFB8C3A
MANATEHLVGRSGGHDWAVFMATSGHFCWPPVGTNYWPLTIRLLDVPGFVLPGVQDRPQVGVTGRSYRPAQRELAGGFHPGW